MKQEHGKTGGFFSRILRKVTGASAVPDTDPATEHPHKRTAEASLTDRKQHNDSVRLQEFSELRALRNQPPTSSFAATATGPAGISTTRPESVGNAASTLKKINAIEEQMSQQWWRKSADAIPPDSQPPAVVVELSKAAALEKAAAEVAQQALAPQSLLPGLQGIEPEEVSINVDRFVALPALEDASIQFANGDIDGAKARVLELLATALERQPIDNAEVAEIWHAALDLYRAVGDEAGFEPLAIDYATHFERSPPLWLSMPAQLGLASLETPAAHSLHPELRWTAPVTLTLEAVQQLEQAEADAAPDVPRHLGWGALQHIAPQALPALAQLLEEWACQKRQFVVEAAEQLQSVLQAYTVPCEAAASPQWWGGRMAALRWLNQPHTFEQVALDYCMTYEVSPPSWVQPVCGVELLGQGGGPALARMPLEEAGSLQREGLWGVLEGDIQPQLAALRAHEALSAVVEVPCNLLIRMDFVAASSLLNWVVELESQGCRVHLTQLHRLVAVFCHVIGIHEHASLQVRRV